MTKLSCSTAADLSPAEVAALVTRAFEGYFVPIEMDEAHLLGMIRRDSVDLADSRVVFADGVAAGVALIARRGWASRVAAMGIVTEWRGKGLGKHLMRQLLEDARSRSDHEMMLEVIEENDPAVKLYQSVGFGKVRRLVSLRLDEAAAGSADGLEEMDIRELANLITIHGLPDLPWQLSAETIAQYGMPLRAYRLRQAYALVSNPELPDVRFYSLLVERETRGRGMAKAIIAAIMACHTGKSWHVPAIFPEEVVGPFEANGFRREILSQWQMRTALVG